MTVVQFVNYRSTFEKEENELKQHFFPGRGRKEEPLGEKRMKFRPKRDLRVRLTERVASGVVDKLSQRNSKSPIVNRVTLRNRFYKQKPSLEDLSFQRASRSPIVSRNGARSLDIGYSSQQKKR